MPSSRTPYRLALCAAALTLGLGACGDDTDDAAADMDAGTDSGEVGDAGATDAGAGDSGASDDAGDDVDTTPPGPWDELVEIGYTRYLGEAVAEVEETDGNVTSYVFDPESGPICMGGGPFRTAVRDTESEDLVIFLQGGGACWSEFCLAVDFSAPGLPTFDLMDETNEANPYVGWDAVYVSYCDGSLLAGDVDVDLNDDGIVDRYLRGLRNLSAAMDVTLQHFPEPRRIVLAGASAGGYATIIATPLVRLLWPDAELLIVNDSGVGLADPEGPAFIEQLIEEFGAGGLVPPSCTDCFASGHMTPLVEWILEHNPDVRIAAISSYEDRIMSGLFLPMSTVEFRAELIAETERLAAAWPGRYQAFLFEGDTHTALLGDLTAFVGPGGGEGSGIGDTIRVGGLDTTQVDGISVGAWLGLMLEGSDDWQTMQE